VKWYVDASKVDAALLASLRAKIDGTLFRFSLQPYDALLGDLRTFAGVPALYDGTPHATLPKVWLPSSAGCGSQGCSWALHNGVPKDQVYSSDEGFIIDDVVI
jgi:hypothetical protein